MPLYQYQCYQCGLRFEAMASASSTVAGKDCVDCGQQAERRITQTQFGFAGEVKRSGAQNSGVSSIDHEIDRIIAEDAHQKWKVINQRRIRKHQLLAENHGVTGYDIHRRNDGDYEVMSLPERQQVESVREELNSKDGAALENANGKEGKFHGISGRAIDRSGS